MEIKILNKVISVHKVATLMKPVPLLFFQTMNRGCLFDSHSHVGVNKPRTSHPFFKWRTLNFLFSREGQRRPRDQAPSEHSPRKARRVEGSAPWQASA